MKSRQAIYWRTHAGLRVWACADSGLPAHYRKVLGAIHAPTSVAAIRAAVGASSDRELFGWLEELDTLGFIQTGRAAAAYYQQHYPRAA